MTNRSLFRFLFGAILILVTWLTLTPNPDDTKQGMSLMRWASEFLFGSAKYHDKLAHFVAYGVLGAFFTFARFTIFGRRLFGALLLAGYGAALEIVQGWLGVRHPEFYDGVANALGAFIAFPIALCVEHIVGAITRRKASTAT